MYCENRRAGHDHDEADIHCEIAHKRGEVVAVGLHARDIFIHVHGPGILFRIVSVAQCLAEVGKFLLHVIGNASVENRHGGIACYGIIGNDNLKCPRAHARAFNGVCRDFALRL